MTHCNKAHKHRDSILSKHQSYKGNSSYAKADIRSCCLAHQDCSLLMTVVCRVFSCFAHL